MALSSRIPDKKILPISTDISQVLKKGGSSIQANQTKPAYHNINLRIPTELLNQVDGLVGKSIVSDTRTRWILEAIADRVKKEGGLS